MPPVDFTSLLVIYGPMGVMLAWFMFVHLTTLKGVTKALNNLSRTQLIDILSRQDLANGARSNAEDLLRKLAKSDTFQPED